MQRSVFPDKRCEERKRSEMSEETCRELWIIQHPQHEIHGGKSQVAAITSLLVGNCHLDKLPQVSATSGDQLSLYMPGQAHQAETRFFADRYYSLITFPDLPHVEG